MLRTLVTTKSRSNSGCWTCRLRRKKCDEAHPRCDACASLEITCTFDDERPPWMDGGPRQKEMADRIKVQVKRRASQRRHRQYMGVLEAGTRAVSLGGDSVLNGLNDMTPPSSGRASPPGHHSDDADAEADLDYMYSTDAGPAAEHAAAAAAPDENNTTGNNDDDDVQFIMIYLDYIFPYLFPFYRPPVLSGGRGWILDTLNRNRTVHHTAMSLASYFFGIIMADGRRTDDSDSDNDGMAARLQAQVQTGLRELHRDIAHINASPRPSSSTSSSSAPSPDTPRKLAAMQSIVNMVVFEVSIHSSDSWRMHLDAAVALFTQVVPSPTPTSWSDTLRALGPSSSTSSNSNSSRWPPDSMGSRRPWSTGQAALRFFAANLVKMDAMASIALDRPPRLSLYLDALAPDHVTPADRLLATRAGPLPLDEYVGLDNYVVRIIFAVSALDSWKKEQLRSGTLDGDDLRARAAALEARVNDHLAVLADLSRRCTPLASTLSSSVVADIVHQNGMTQSSIAHDDPAHVLFSRVWLLGMLAYLGTIVHGWRPGHPDISRHVGHITEAARLTPHGSCVRGVALPICIAGCLAPREDEKHYRATVGGLGPLRNFGSMKDVGAIMEAVWDKRNELDESWDVSKCLRVLGHPVLII